MITSMFGFTRCVWSRARGRVGTPIPMAWSLCRGRTGFIWERPCAANFLSVTPEGRSATQRPSLVIVVNHIPRAVNHTLRSLIVSSLSCFFSVGFQDRPCKASDVWAAGLCFHGWIAGKLPMHGAEWVKGVLLGGSLVFVPCFHLTMMLML